MFVRTGNGYLVLHFKLQNLLDSQVSSEDTIFCISKLSPRNLKEVSLEVLKFHSESPRMKSHLVAAMEIQTDEASDFQECRLVPWQLHTTVFPLRRECLVPYVPPNGKLDLGPLSKRNCGFPYGWLGVLFLPALLGVIQGEVS